MFSLLLIPIFLLLTITPSYAFLKPKKLSSDSITISLILGVPLISLSIFLLSLLPISIKPIYLFLLINAISLFKLKVKLPKIKKINYALIFTIILSLVSITFYTYQQKYNQTTGLTFYSEPNAHDSLWHAALQNNLKVSIPPENPVYSNTILKGYHYFTDIYFSLFSSFTKINTIDLAIRYIPLITGLIFVLSNHLLSKTIFKKQILRNLSTFLLTTYSAQPYLFAKIFPKATIHPSMFWLDQPATYLINPQLVISISILNVFIYLLIKNKEISLKYLLALPSLVGIKIYSLITFLPTLFIKFLENKKPIKKFGYPILTLGLVGIIVLLIGNNSDKSPFFFSPGWFIKQMFTASDRLNHDVWELRRLHYVEVGSKIHLIKQWLYGLNIFLVGNFGLILLPFLVSVFKNKKKINLVLLPIILTSIIFPLVFLQSGVVWNTIQVLTYARIPIILSVLLWLKTKHEKLTTIILILLISISLPTIYLTYKSTREQKNYQNYSAELISSIKELKRDNKEYLLDHKKLNDTALIPAISSIPLYAADSTVLTILNLDPDSRINEPCSDNLIFLTYQNDKIIEKGCNN